MPIFTHNTPANPVGGRKSQPNVALAQVMQGLGQVGQFNRQQALDQRAAEQQEFQNMVALQQLDQQQQQIDNLSTHRATAAEDRDADRELRKTLSEANLNLSREQLQLEKERAKEISDSKKKQLELQEKIFAHRKKGDERAARLAEQQLAYEAQLNDQRIQAQLAQTENHVNYFSGIRQQAIKAYSEKRRQLDTIISQSVTPEEHAAYQQTGQIPDVVASDQQIKGLISDIEFYEKEIPKIDQKAHETVIRANRSTPGLGGATFVDQGTGEIVFDASPTFSEPIRNEVFGGDQGNQLQGVQSSSPQPPTRQNPQGVNFLPESQGGEVAPEGYNSRLQQPQALPNQLQGLMETNAAPSSGEVRPGAQSVPNNLPSFEEGVSIGAMIGAEETMRMLDGSFGGSSEPSLPQGAQGMFQQTEMRQEPAIDIMKAVQDLSNEWRTNRQRDATGFRRPVGR